MYGCKRSSKYIVNIEKCSIWIIYKVWGRKVWENKRVPQGMIYEMGSKWIGVHMRRIAQFFKVSRQTFVKAVMEDFPQYSERISWRYMNLSCCLNEPQRAVQAMISLHPFLLSLSQARP